MDLESVVSKDRAGLVSERLFLVVSLLLFAASAGLTVYGSTSGAMSIGMMDMASMPDQTWLGAAAVFEGMWVVMMLAMMLPSLVPTLLGYRRAARGSGMTRLAGLTARAGTGYFLIWAVFGVAAYLLSTTLASAEMRWSDLARFVPGVVLLLTGCFQLTAGKTRQLVCCRVMPTSINSPAPSARDAWRYGLRLGVHCMVCCLGFMLILLVNGLMDLALMGVVAAVITGERILPEPARIARMIGIASLAIGLFVLVRALTIA